MPCHSLILLLHIKSCGRPDSSCILVNLLNNWRRGGANSFECNSSLLIRGNRPNGTPKNLFTSPRNSIGQKTVQSAPAIYDCHKAQHILIWNKHVYDSSLWSFETNILLNVCLCFNLWLLFLTDDSRLSPPDKQKRWLFVQMALNNPGFYFPDKPSLSVT